MRSGLRRISECINTLCSSGTLATAVPCSRVSAMSCAVSGFTTSFCSEAGQWACLGAFGSCPGRS